MLCLSRPLIPPGVFSQLIKSDQAFEDAAWEHRAVAQCGQARGNNSRLRNSSWLLEVDGIMKLSNLIESYLESPDSRESAVRRLEIVQVQGHYSIINMVEGLETFTLGGATETA